MGTPQPDTATHTSTWAHTHSNGLTPCPPQHQPEQGTRWDSVGLLGAGASTWHLCTQTADRTHWRPTPDSGTRRRRTVPSPEHSPCTSPEPSAASAKGACRQPAAQPEVTGPRIQSSQAPDYWRPGQWPRLKSGEGVVAVEQLPAFSALGPRRTGGEVGSCRQQVVPGRTPGEGEGQ